MTSRVPDLGDHGNLQAGQPQAGQPRTGQLETEQLDGATRVESRIDSRIDTAVGIVMSLHHLDQAQAIDMLVRLSHRARTQIREATETIVDTGVLPDPDRTAPARPVAPDDQSGWR